MFLYASKLINSRVFLRIYLPLDISNNDKPSILFILSFKT